MYGQLISSVTVGAGGAANITFTAIPGNYTDLCLVVSGRSGSGTADASIYFYLNNDATALTYRWLYGSGSATSSGTSSAITGFVGSGATANTFSNGMLYIPNYAGSTNKSWSLDNVTEGNATRSFQFINAGLWSNTAAITSIKIDDGGWGLLQYTTASLYGLTKGSGGATVS